VNSTAMSVTIGIDLGDKHSQVYELDHETGEILSEGRVSTTPRAFKRRFGGCPPARIAFEAGTHSRWIAILLEAAGHEVIVANPRKVRLICDNDTKTDRLDAERLALLARADPRLLHPIHHRGAEVHVDLAVIRARDALVRQRTGLINHVRGAVKQFGIRVTGCSSERFHKAAGEALTDELRPALEPLLEQIGALTKAIQGYDKRVNELAKTKYPEATHLQQVPGVGALTALAFVLTLEDPYRFRSSRAVGSYLGLRPRQRDSSSSTPQLRITKAGDGHLRRLLVGSAHYILGPFGPDTDLRRWGLKLSARGGQNAKKRAVVAVARKLAVLLHALWLSGETYDPHRSSAPKAA
jgi:transposase